MSYMKSLSLPVPYIIAMVGLPGTGKSYFATTFADNFRAPHVDELYFCHLAHKPSDGTQMAADVLHEIMKTSQAIIFEGKLDTKEERESLVRFGQKRKYEVLFVWVQADPDTSKKRALKHMSAGEYKARLKTFVPPSEKESYIVISGHHTHATQARTLLKHLTGPRSQIARTATPPSRPRAAINPRRIS